MRLPWLALVATLGCAAPCVPGETVACTCADGRPSARICRASGQFDPCACGGTDGGLDAGQPDPACVGNSPPLNSMLSPTWAHLPIGGIDLQPPSFRDAEGDPLTLTLFVFDGDGGALGPPVILDGGLMRVTLPAPGEYVVEVRAFDGCNVSFAQVLATGVDGRRLPFEVTTGLCCDELGRPWLGASDPPRLMRLETDGGWETLAFLPRKPTSFSLSLDGGRLAVGEDSRVSVFQIGQPVPWVPDWTAPIATEPRLVVLGNTAAWGFGDSFAEGIDLDGGARSSLDYRIRFSQPAQGALTSDGRFVVINADNQFLELLAVSGTQLVPTTADTSPRTCGGAGVGLWTSSSHAHFFTGCGEVWEVIDGGFVQAGTLPAAGTLLGLGEDARGNLAGAFAFILPSREPAVVWIDGRTFAQTGSVTRDFISGMGPGTRLLPRFVFLDAEGAANVLTVLDEPSSTWWETFK